MASTSTKNMTNTDTKDIEEKLKDALELNFPTLLSADFEDHAATCKIVRLVAEKAKNLCQTNVCIEFTREAHCGTLLFFHVTEVMIRWSH